MPNTTYDQLVRHIRDNFISHMTVVEIQRLHHLAYVRARFLKDMLVKNGVLVG